VQRDCLVKHILAIDQGKPIRDEDDDALRGRHLPSLGADAPTPPQQRTSPAAAASALGYEQDITTRKSGKVPAG
jgi:hypothetical protein